MKLVRVLLALVTVVGTGQAATTFTDVTQKVFSPYCLDCHAPPDPSKGLNLEDYKALMASGVVVPFQPDKSLIVKKVESGSMPKGGDPLTASEIALLRDWILQGALDAAPVAKLALASVSPRAGSTAGGTLVKLEGQNLAAAKRAYFDKEPCGNLQVVDDKTVTCITPPHAAGAVAVRLESDSAASEVAQAFEYRLPLGPTYAALFVNVFKPKCVGCHSGNNPPKGLDLASYASMMAHRRAVIPFDVKRSRVYKKTSDGEMPKDGAPLSSTEIGYIGQWIRAGAKEN